jgi:hypothetical protein
MVILEGRCTSNCETLSLVQAETSIEAHRHNKRVKDFLEDNFVFFMSAFSLLKVLVVHSVHNLDESCGKNHVEFVSNPADFQKCSASV